MRKFNPELGERRPGWDFDETNPEVHKAVDAFFHSGFKAESVQDFLQKFPGATEELIVSVKESFPGSFSRTKKERIIRDLRKAISQEKNNEIS